MVNITPCPDKTFYDMNAQCALFVVAKLLVQVYDMCLTCIIKII